MTNETKDLLKATKCQKQVPYPRTPRSRSWRIHYHQCRRNAVAGIIGTREEFCRQHIPKEAE